MNFPVKWFSSDMTGAPSLDGTAGSLIAVLDGCLINGFGELTLTSLAMSGGVATATIDAGHDYLVHSVIEIAGATPAGLNGEQRIVSVTATTFTFVTTEDDGTATGTKTAKIPAIANWEKAYTGTNKAAYRSTDPQTTGLLLRVADDAGLSEGARFAEVRGYETMSDVDSGTGLFPTAAQTASDGIWFKAYVEDATVAGWKLIADTRGFFFFPQPRVGYPFHRGAYWFGDIDPVDSSDTYHCMLISQGPTANVGSAPGSISEVMKLNTYLAQAQLWHHMARSYNQTGTAVGVGKHCTDSVFTGYMSGGGFAYPNPAGNGLIAATILLTESSVMRGMWPGYYNPLHARPLTDGDFVTDMDGLPDRTLWVVDSARATSWSTSNSYLIQSLIDITGPWR